MSRQTVITIGNFDGVHLGHERLLRAARDLAGENGRVLALVIDPHPFTVLRPQAAPPRLSTLAQRSRRLRGAGADDVIALHPTPQFLAQTPQQFIEALAREYAPSFIVEGPDFHFGRGRSGSIATLRELEPVHRYRTIVIEPVQAALGDQSLVQVSSSIIRWLLERGRVSDVRLLLGRSYDLEAPVVAGDKRGRSIGVPTVNLGPTECMLPGDGIYAGSAVRPDGERFPAAISVGAKPTFGEHPRVCEAHLIGYAGPLDDYGWTVRLEFHHWLRDQLAFPSVELLTDQLRRDIDRTLETMRHQGIEASRHQGGPLLHPSFSLSLGALIT